MEMLNRGFALGMAHCGCTLLFTKDQSLGILSGTAHTMEYGLSLLHLILKHFKETEAKVHANSGELWVPQK